MSCRDKLGLPFSSIGTRQHVPSTRWYDMPEAGDFASMSAWAAVLLSRLLLGLSCLPLEFCAGTPIGCWLMDSAAVSPESESKGLCGPLEGFLSDPDGLLSLLHTSTSRAFVQLNPPFRDQIFSYSLQISRTNEWGIRPKCKKIRKYNSVESTKNALPAYSNAG